MWGFLKSSEAVIGPGGIVVLPPDDANIFHHEAELVLVFGRAGKDIRAGKDVKEEEALDYVFGYTCGVDVSARMPPAPGGTPAALEAWRGVAAHKSFPTFAPIGPAIVTKDQMSDPLDLRVRLSVNDEFRGDFNTSDMAHSITKSIAFVSSYESFSPGDILYTGTNHQGLGAMQDGDKISIDIDQVGGFSFQDAGLESSNLSNLLAGRRKPLLDPAKNQALARACGQTDEFVSHIQLAA